MMYDYSPEEDKKLVKDYLTQKALSDDQARQQRLAAGLGEAGATIGAAISGTKVDSPFYQGLAEQADKQAKDKIQLAEYLAKKDQELADRLEKKKINEASALADQEKLNWEKKRFDLEQQNKQKELGYKGQEVALKAKEIDKKTEPKPFQDKLAGLNTGDKQRYDHAKSGLQAAESMKAALESGEDTWKVIGDNDFTLARKNYVEAIGRMNSGGQIGPQEATNFIKMLPSAVDPDDIKKKKLEEAIAAMESRVNTLGFTRDEVLGSWSPKLASQRSAPKGSAIAAPSGPNAAAKGQIDYENMSPEDLEKLAKQRGIK